jgi:DNA-binding MarR family transcriptional regulator
MSARASNRTVFSDRTVSSEARALTEVVTRLRRTLRTSIRTDYPWESLPMAQVELLLALHDHQPARVGQLANLLRLAPNTISGLVQVLVEAGLATRAPDPCDRRVAVVTLTEAGRTKLADWEQAHQQRIGNALNQLPTADQTTVRAALPALARLVDHLAAPTVEKPAAVTRDV